MQSGCVFIARRDVPLFASPDAWVAERWYGVTSAFLPPGAFGSAAALARLCRRAAPQRGAARPQDVARITHRDDVAAMVRKGRDLERLVLARAVRWVLQDRVLVHSNKTVVFEE